MTDDEIVKWILANRGKLEKRIVGALKSSIHSHGPISYQNVSSAGKRVWGSLKGLIRDLRINPKPEPQEEDGEQRIETSE